MENNIQNSGNSIQSSLPNSTASLVLGILSIVGCWCYGLFGIILGIIGLVLSKKDIELYKANPEAYTSSSYGNVKAGKICSIIGVAGGGAYILFLIIYIIIYGAFFAFQDFA
jgi:hypothetical protein